MTTNTSACPAQAFLFAPLSRTQRETAFLFGPDSFAQNSETLVSRLLEPMIQGRSYASFNLHVFPYEERIVAATTYRSSVSDGFSGRRGLFLCFGIWVARSIFRKHWCTLAASYKIVDQFISDISGYSIADNGGEKTVSMLQETHLHDDEYLPAKHIRALTARLEAEFGCQAEEGRANLFRPRQCGEYKYLDRAHVVPLNSPSDILRRWGYLDALVQLSAMTRHKDAVSSIISLCLDRGVPWERLVTEVMLCSKLGKTCDPDIKRLLRATLADEFQWNLVEQALRRHSVDEHSIRSIINDARAAISEERLTKL